MTKANYSKFKTYLQSISEKYKCWWNLYTLTEAEGKKQQAQQFSSPSSPFDFGLMVQTVQPKQKQEKPERFLVLEGIRKYANNHVLLVGKPGSGKSTALARLLLEKAENHTPNPSSLTWRRVLGLDKTGEGWSIPVLVELRYWQTSVFERIQAFLHQHDANLNLDETTLKTLLRQGKFLLLVDGVNELPSEDARRQVAIFRKDYPQTPMIFTTRDLAVGGDLGIEKKLEIQPLNETQMREFVMSYLPQQGEEMLQCLEDRLQEFGKTPLLLWMLCGLYEQTGNIPPNLGMVFRLFTQNYENNWRGDVAVSTESRRWWKSLLEHLAFMMMQGESVTEFRVAIPKREVEEIFTQYLDAEKLDKPRDYAKCWLEDLLNHHLIQVGSGDKIEFRHQLLQEYYASEYLLRKIPDINNAKLRRDYLNLLKWTEPVALMLALVEDEAQALRVVKLALDVDLILGARLTGEVKPKFQQQTVNFILNKKLTKLLETQLLDISRSDCAVDVLINTLNDEDSEVRRIAAEALGKIGCERAVNALINALYDEDSKVSRSATDALGEIGNEAAVNVLINNLLNHHDLVVRSSAAYRLGKIRSKQAVDALIHTLNDDEEDSIVRYSATEALENIGGKQAVNILINGLKHKDSNVRWKAVEAIANIFNDKAVNYLISSLYDNQFVVSLKAINVLEKIGNTAVINIFCEVLNSNTHPFIRERIVEALVNIGDKNIHDYLIKGLKNRGLKNRCFEVHLRILAALVKLGYVSMKNHLVSATYHENPEVRWRAIHYLGQVGSKSEKNTLIEALEDENSDVRRYAAQALGQIGTELDINALIKVLEDKNSEVRCSVAIALGNIGGEAAVDALINALEDEDLNVRTNVTSALRETGSEKAINPLINSLNDKDSSVRSSAANALGEIGSEAVADALINALNYEGSFICSRTADALGKIAGSDKIAQMWELFHNGTSEAKDIISKIQERCKFYNHNIFHSPAIEDDKNLNIHTSSYINNFYGNVGNVNTSDVKIEGNQIGIQNNQ